MFPPTQTLSSAPDVPSAPDIEKVEPFSSTAIIHFEEPASAGGVPVLSYRLQWRIPGRDWTSKEFRAEEGEATVVLTPPQLCSLACQASPRHVGTPVFPLLTLGHQVFRYLLPDRFHHIRHHWPEAGDHLRGQDVGHQR